MPDKQPDERQWLTNKITELRTYIMLIVDDYDNGRLTRDAAGARIGIMCKDSMSTTYDHAFTKGIEAADLADGETEEEFDIEFEEDDDEGDVDYHD